MKFEILQTFTGCYRIGRCTECNPTENSPVAEDMGVFTFLAPEILFRISYLGELYRLSQMNAAFPDKHEWVYFQES